MILDVKFDDDPFLKLTKYNKKGMHPEKNILGSMSENNGPTE